MFAFICRSFYKFAATFVNFTQCFIIFASIYICLHPHIFVGTNIHLFAAVSCGPPYRLKRGHQQREANYKGSTKEEKVCRVLCEFPLTLRPKRNSNFFFKRSSFDTSFSF